MTLLKNNNNENIIEILQKDPSSEKMKLRLYLSEVPDRNWSTIFNRTHSRIESFSIQESRAVIVLIERTEYEKNNFILEIIDKINKTDMEVIGDTTKRNIFKSVLKPGVVAVHDGLSFEGVDERILKYDPEKRFLKETEGSQLENFVKQTVNNYTVE